MSVHKHNPDITKSSPPPRKAPVPQVDREHLAELRKLERNPHYFDNKFGDSAKGPVRSEK